MDRTVPRAVATGPTICIGEGQWSEFAERLQNEMEANPCAHTHARTRGLLTEFGYDIESSMAYLKSQGGCCCDCEVVYNVILAEKIRGGKVRLRRRRPNPRKSL